MDIHYDKKKIKKYCEIFKEASRQYGTDIARKINQWISELAAFENLDEVVSTYFKGCHLLKGNRKGCYAVDLNNQYRIVFKPYIEDLSLNLDDISMEDIKVIIIKEICDYHD
ncbi:MAG: hypothetical protein FJW68_08890 [Actinobacteria bacterium]|nr:hypothetical protein [Actinomycetota bacterium]